MLINGIRILDLWYSPLADTGQVTFSYPFITFCTIAFTLSAVIGFILYKKKSNRFILIRGPMRVRSVIRAVLRDRLGISIVLTYVLSYLVSYMITSGLLIVPGINVDRYFTDLTVISYEGNGINVIHLFDNIYLVINPVLLIFGVLVDAFLTFSLILSYYVVSLIYVSVNVYDFPVLSKNNLRIYTFNTFGGFLTASVPSIGTIGGICCLTPTAINSLLYLSSATLPLTKGLTWKYGTFLMGVWTGGILQAFMLASPVILGVVLSTMSFYYIYQISKRLNEVTVDG
ncbi:hypothetical protein SUSAZ_09180 [Sulfolobus acidocaldarius SUSAZ]|nr:hypothetical protein SUSAZ_09180 [Sulfolobus acidocaldarius SUSAZ]